MADFNRGDLDFILRQIAIADQHRTREDEFGAPVAGTPLDVLVDNPHLPYGLRTVDGRYNNIIPGRENFGAADTVFPRMLEPTFRPEYEASTSPSHLVTDAQPRVISNLVVDQTLDNIAAIAVGLAPLGLEETATRDLAIGINGLWNALKAAQAAFLNNTGTEQDRDAAKAALDSALSTNGIEILAKFRPAGSTAVPILDEYGSLVLQNFAPDEGISAPFNSWMTLFGQFFDHGLDLVTKGNSGTVFVPLSPDDPLFNPNNPAGNFMALTRATNQPGPDGIVGTTDDIREHTNTTTSWVDQNQTYTSHASHQVFLREYVDTNGSAAGGIYATGHLSNGTDGSMPTWAEVKANALMLGIQLSDEDVTDVPLLATDEYGRYLRSPDGYAQVVVRTYVEGSYNPNDPLTYTDTLVSGSPTSPLNIKAIDDALGSHVVRTGHAFLDDIAHSANPRDSQTGRMKIADGDGLIGTTLTDNSANQATVTTESWLLERRANVVENPNYTGPDPVTDPVGFAAFEAAVLRDGLGNLRAYTTLAVQDRPFLKTSEVYDEEFLGRHFVTGDGRGNENIGLTTVHHVFHAEHNRLADQVMDQAIAAGQAGDLAFLNQWLRPDGQVTAMPTDLNDLQWNGESVFQAARFGTEMQYQHLVFEEFGRKVSPAIDLFVFNPTMEIDPSIVAEFAHVVYRFGHSMLNETVDRVLDQSTQDQMTLVEAFLNPLAFNNTVVTAGVAGPAGLTAEEASGALVRGMTQQRGNAIDEHVTDALRNFLVGVPLDLAVLNIARGRDTGVPSLNAAREAFFAESNSEWVRPYSGWSDFSGNLKNPLSIVNFIAAYGTHASLTDPVGGPVLTMEQRRDAALALVFGMDAGEGGDNDPSNGVTIRGQNYDAADVAAFLNGTGIYATARGGMDHVDLWVGGLAERILPFGGMLGATFNFVFEKQMENLQNADRFYYLSRTQGLNFLTELESNSFAELIMNNTDLNGAHLPGEVFANMDHILEVNQDVQTDYNGGTRLDGVDPVAGVTRATNEDVDGTTYANYLQYVGGLHVVLGGTDQNDALIASDGDDTLWGDAGHDVLKGGVGVNRLHGGEGNDLIFDSGDAGFLHGEGGDDYISAGAGVGELIFGDAGNDFIKMGDDAKEAFAGEGNDFVVGTGDVDFILGGGGDDWLEAGEGFDTTAGDNSELFFNSTVIGHDVMFAGTNEHDFDAESGDDIMVQGEGIMRSEGMFGFDWSIYKGNALAANANLGIPLLANNPADVLRSRFDRVEALSGWNQNDTLIGDSRIAPTVVFDPNGNVDADEFGGDGIDRAGVDRISGMRDLLGLTAEQLDTFGTGIVFESGNVLIGGRGSDRMEGRGGNDIIDGDKWLNVRIAIVIDNVEVGTLERISPREVMGFTTTPRMDLVKIHNLNGPHANLHNQPIADLLEARAITGSNMVIVREILDGNQTGDLDTAVFRGASGEYAITADGNATIVTHTTPATVALDDGVDRLTNIERLKFSNLAETNFTVAENFSGNLFRIPIEVTGATQFVLSGADAGLFSVVTVSGVRFLRLNSGLNFETPTDAGSNGVYDVTITQTRTGTTPVSFVDNVHVHVSNVAEAPTGTFQVTSATPTSAAQTSATLTAADLRVDQDLISGGNPTGAVSAAPAAYQWEQLASLTATSGTPLAGQTSMTSGSLSNGIFRLRSTYTDLFGASTSWSTLAIVGSAASQTVTGNGGNDLLVGLAGNDSLNGGTGADTMMGGIGNDTYTVDNAGDVVSEVNGGGTDVVNSSISVDMSGWAGIENLTLTGTGITNGTGNGGNNVMNGNGSANVLTGGAGNDTVNGNGGDDRFVATVGDGTDTYNGGTQTTARGDVLDLSGTTAGATVNLNNTVFASGVSGTALRASSADIGTDTLSGIESVIGSSGSDILIGNNGANVINGGGGADALRGFTGIDTFEFVGAFGTDTVVDFHRDYAGTNVGAFNAATRDILNLDGMVNDFADFADMAAHSQIVGGDVVIYAKTTAASATGAFGTATDIDLGNSITLQGVSQAQFLSLSGATGDFIF